MDEKPPSGLSHDWLGPRRWQTSGGSNRHVSAVDEVKGKPGFAVTDAAGNFSVQTFDPGDGLTEGTHRVALRKTVMLDRQGNEVKEIREPGDAKETHLVARKLEDFKTSGLEVQIKPEASNVLATFEVTSK